MVKHADILFRLSFEASRLANLVIMYRLNRDEAMPYLGSLGSAGQAWMRRCLAAVSNGTGGRPKVSV